MKPNGILLEVFDKPYKYRLMRGFDSVNELPGWLARWRTADGRSCDLMFDSKSNKGDYETQFSCDYRHNLTGQGDAFRIMATVMAILEDILEDAHREAIRSVSFSAEVSEPGRVRLYTRLLSRLAKKNDMEFASRTTRHMVKFSMRKTKPQLAPVESVSETRLLTRGEFKEFSGMRKAMEKGRLKPSVLLARIDAKGKPSDVMDDIMLRSLRKKVLGHLAWEKKRLGRVRYGIAVKTKRGDVQFIHRAARGDAPPGKPWQKTRGSMKGGHVRLKSQSFDVPAGDFAPHGHDNHETLRAAFLDAWQWDGPLEVIDVMESSEALSEALARCAEGTLTESKLNSVRVRRKKQRSHGHPQAQQHGHEIWIYPKFDELPHRDSQIHVMLHELGHWFREWNVPLTDIMGFEPGEGFFGVYGYSNSEEGFAEAFATYFTDPPHLMSKWPDAFKKIQVYVKGSGMSREFWRFASTAVDKLRSEQPQREDRDYKRERLNEPKSRVKKRAQRNTARRRAVKKGSAKKGDGTHVHHGDGNPHNNGTGNLSVRKAGPHCSDHKKADWKAGKMEGKDNRPHGSADGAPPKGSAAEKRDKARKRREEVTVGKPRGVVLSEAAKKPGDIPEGFGIMIQRSHAGTAGINILLWDTNKGRRANPLTGHPVHGVIQIQQPNKSLTKGDCSGAWMVKWAGVKNGWGPLLYDVAMEVATVVGGGLMADRDSVSKDADSVWAYYEKQRRDVEKDQLDNPEGELTPNIEWDDCGQVSANKWKRGKRGWTSAPESKAYRKKGLKVVRALNSMGKLRLDGVRLPGIQILKPKGRKKGRKKRRIAASVPAKPEGILIETSQVTEAARTPAKLPKGIGVHVALYPGDDWGHVQYWDLVKDRPSDHGSVEFSKPTTQGSCSGAWEVNLTSARRGYGPLLYDVAMECATIWGGGLMSDRESVSGDANRVWDFYSNRRRTGIRKHQLDNLQGELTPQKPKDDCNQDSARTWNRKSWTDAPQSKNFTKTPTKLKSLAKMNKLILGRNVRLPGIIVVKSNTYEESRSSPGGRILYHIGKRPAAPKPAHSKMQNTKDAGSGEWERPGRDPVEVGVFLTTKPNTVAAFHGVGGHVYAYRVPEEVIRASGGLRMFDGAPEILIPKKLWARVKFLGKSKDVDAFNQQAGNVPPRVWTRSMDQYSNRMGY